VEVIAQDAVPVQLNGEVLYEEIQPIDEPLFAMAKVVTGIRVETAQERVPHTPGDEVIDQRRLGIDLEFSWLGHACSVR